ncbi:hypothetical protein Avbf_18495, partial [Armadillidium vulgare]
MVIVSFCEKLLQSSKIEWSKNKIILVRTFRFYNSCKMVHKSRFMKKLLQSSDNNIKNRG